MGIFASTLVVSALEEFCMRKGAGRCLAFDCWEVVAVVELVDLAHLFSSAHASVVAYAHFITGAFTHFAVVKERSTIAFAPLLHPHILHATDILAKMEAHLWGHWQPVFFGHLLVVPNLLLCLSIKDATNLPHACGAPHGINRVWAWK